MTKTIIEQADEIVGINVEAIGLAPEHKAMLRRGAYFDWLMKNVDADETMVCGTINHTAGWIVRLHAESKPKGDGLPDDWQVKVVGTGAYCVRVSPSNDALGFEQSTADAVMKYIARCLSPATRRFLAAFECVEQRPTDIGCFAWGYLNGEPVMVSGPPDGNFPIPERDVICYLKPREAK